METNDDIAKEDYHIDTSGDNKHGECSSSTREDASDEAISKNPHNKHQPTHSLSKKKLKRLQRRQKEIVPDHLQTQYTRSCPPRVLSKSEIYRDSIGRPICFTCHAVGHYHTVHQTQK